ncbi:MAG: carboxypeptidase regulatory-like domain-containing protein, partial [Phycisphaerae bacterium]|nr:carboxypeptidase regulatory-like domain-containing protein [Gemmatimonadaceae bacterium]
VRAQNGSVIAGVRVLLEGTGRTVYTDELGRFAFSNLTAGRYPLRLLRIGYRTVSDTLNVERGASPQIECTMIPVPTQLSEMLITPGAFQVLDQRAASQQSMSREALNATPQLVEDLFRSLNRLPGMSGSDFSAKFRIRNGGADEQLVLLDGLELIEPYHLKDFDGALSMIDADALSRVNINAGGFGVQWGNRMAGIVDLTSATPSNARSHTALGLSLSNFRARTEGSFKGARGSWMLSARRGYLDIVFKLVGEEDPPDPSYYDVFGKVQYQLSARHTVALRTLLAGDQLKFNDDNQSFINSRYSNRYVWGTLTSQLSPSLRVTTLASAAAHRWQREGRELDRFANQFFNRLLLTDTRSLNNFALKQDWTFDFTPRLSAIVGASGRHEWANYQYSRTMVDAGNLNGQVRLTDTTRLSANIEPAGNQLNGYAALRTRLGSHVTSEFGLRADYQAWTSQTTVSPRFNIAIDAASATVIRGAWGYYHQGEGLHDLSVVDGDTTFVRSELAEHRIIGLERLWRGKWSTRVEAYQRLVRHPRARYLNVDGNLNALPEGAADRTLIAPSSASVRGLELMAQYDGGGKWRASSSYTLADARMVIEGVETERPFSERHALASDVTWRANRKWTISTAFTAHSGWPTVPATYSVQVARPNVYIVRRTTPVPVFTGHLPTYWRLDLRVARTFTTQRGVIRRYADIFNALNRQNVRGYDYDPSISLSGTVAVRSFPEKFLGRLPSIGVSWEF